jgi:hypothetical protein
MPETETTPAAPAPAATFDPVERRALAATLLPGLMANEPGTTDAHLSDKAAKALKAADAIFAASQKK